MNKIFNNLCQRILDSTQIVWIAVVCVLLVALIATNVLLILYFRRNRERKLCTHQLQGRREELLKQLQILIDGGVIVEDKDEDEDEEAMLVVDSPADDKEDAAEASKPFILEMSADNGDETLDTDVLAAASLSAASRQRLNIAGAECDSKLYYVRYTFSFEARLRNSSEEVKQRYLELVNDIAQYKVKMQYSYNQIRVYRAHTTLALIIFSGKHLCVAYALNPADYADTKYRGIDKSSKKRFAKTPMLLKITSPRKLQYAKYLMLQLADANAIGMVENPAEITADLTAQTITELYDEGKLRILLLGEAPQTASSNDEEITDDLADKTELNEESAEVNDGYDRSFVARIVQADDSVKDRYSALKNHILRHIKVYNKLSWKREAFYDCKGNCIATFAIRGKTLRMFLAEDPVKFDGTKYKVESIADKYPDAKLPTMYRVRTQHDVKLAKEMVNIVFGAKGIADNPDYKETDFRPAYKTTESLIKKGYIRETEQKNVIK